MESLRRLMSLAFLLSCLAMFQTAGAQEFPEVLKDAPPQKLMAVGLGLMDLEDDRKAEFGRVVDDFSVKTVKAIRKIMKSNEPGMPRKIGKRLKRAFKDLDKQMEPIVPKEKWEAYLIFKKGLADQLTPGR